jgi:isoleucyl-tRNA synthetase
VFLNTWFDFPAGEQAQAIDWGLVLQVRQAVARELERLRINGDIGSSLDAEVDLYADERLKAELDKLGEELRFALITSAARVHPAAARPDDAAPAGDPKGVWIAAARSSNPKCARCWHRRADVGADRAHPELCGRCVENVFGAGEIRKIA